MSRTFNWNSMPDVNRPTKLRGPKHGPRPMKNDFRMWEYVDGKLIKVATKRQTA